MTNEIAYNKWHKKESVNFYTVLANRYKYRTNERYKEYSREETY